MPTPITRRNPGRMDGAQWKGGQFICGRQIDDGDLVDHADADALESHQESHQEVVEEKQRTIELNVTIMDIARPAKVKGTFFFLLTPKINKMFCFSGVAKEYDIIESVRKVIALEENEREVDLWEDETDDWEELYDEEINQRKSYSDILRGYET